MQNFNILATHVFSVAKQGGLSLHPESFARGGPALTFYVFMCYVFMRYAFFF